MIFRVKFSPMNRLCSHQTLQFVPRHSPVTEHDVDRLQEFLDVHKPILVLTGAGISTESGIPDYRSENTGLYSRSTSRPVIYKDFMSSEAVRKRYWARNYVGWPRFSSFQPNTTHFVLTKWKKNGSIHWIITQNVDRLHHKAGSEHVIELHGTSHQVKCTNCGHSFSRFTFQDVLSSLNNVLSFETVEVRPDGDVELDSRLVSDFQVPNCNRCGGILKPNIVFFGENVPMDRVKYAMSKLEESKALLVLGSSLQVYSAYRFLLAANEQKKPVAIVNIGPTRADNIALLKLNNRCTDILSRIKI
ncbi:NAD-dependent protein lipoamidase sirtuin-4, mitochondrial-like [Centruroides sculpturatus]|uniref:NAD-dependent protein lipoamidase sirtuin-4, mitochondrial-like n=1 Tax=Centruroides sculpturatus TaxID=218467 RepID=UPI000C6F01B4|nr:NAD-dependent protein lipoamidase sirtuin-4, mitochondrial-like [Centruroides sculpturatus]